MADGGPSILRGELGVPSGLGTTATLRPAQKRRVDRTRRAGAAALALLVTANYWKRLAGFDPTVALTLVVAVCVAASAIRGFPLVPRGASLVLGCFATFLPGAALANPNAFGMAGDYATDKVSQLFTITLLVTVAPMFLIRDRRDLRVFLAVLVGVGAAACLNGLVAADPSRPDRLRTDANGSINLARAAGTALVVVGAGVMRRRIRVPVGVALAAPMASVAWLSGSRGPLLGAVLGIVALAFAGRSRTRDRMVLAAVFVGALLALIQYPTATADRLSVTGSSSRLEHWGKALDDIADRPWGSGWGSFFELHPPPRIRDGQDTHHPHNLFLEAGAEGGLLALAGIGTLVIAGARRSSRRTATFEGAAFYGLLVTWLVNASVSTDINGNRLLFCLLGVGLALQLTQRGTTGAVRPIVLRRRDPDRLGHRP